MNAFAAGEAEDLARKRKAAALPAALGALYAEIRTLREAGGADGAPWALLHRAAAAHPSDWLLAAELQELNGEGAHP